MRGGESWKPVINVGAVVGLLLLASFDAVREIPPVGDDFWILSTERWGGLSQSYAARYGWAARPVGMGLMDTAAAAVNYTGLSTLSVVMILRVVCLATIYVALRRVASLPAPVAVLAVILFGLTPPAGEGWAQLANLHLAASASTLALTVAMYLSAVAGQCRSIRWRLVAAASLCQAFTVALHEQSILAAPAFVCVLVIWRVAGGRLPFRTGLGVLAVPTAVAIASTGALMASGYSEARSGCGGGPCGLESRDFLDGAHRLWAGYGQHNVWRLVEMVRTDRWGWWDQTAVGYTSALATAVLGVIAFRCAWRLPIDAGLRGRTNLTRSEFDSMAAAVMVAALVAGYAGILPVGLAYPGFPLNSRLFLIPGFFFSLFLALLVGVCARRWRAVSAVLTAVVVVWSGMTARKYIGDMRSGARIGRAMAMAVGSTEVGTNGVLVIAPATLGTFATSAVEYWSFPSAVKHATNATVRSRLFFAHDCGAARRVRPEIVDEHGRDVGLPPYEWEVVMSYERVAGVRITPTIEKACEAGQWSSRQDAGTGR